MSSSTVPPLPVILRDDSSLGLHVLVPAGMGVELQEKLSRASQLTVTQTTLAAHLPIDGQIILGFGHVHPEPIRTALTAANCTVEVSEEVRYPERTYQAPVDRLLSVGPMGKIGDFSQESVPELLRLATDLRLHTAPDVGPLRWAPIHAARALAGLKVATAVRPLVNLVKHVPDSVDSPVATEFPRLLGEFGTAALDPIAGFLLRGSGSVTAQITCARVISEIGQQHPAARLDCVSRLRLVLASASQRTARLNSQIISDLVDLQGVEAAAEIERTFTTGPVDTGVAGDWGSVQIALGLKSAAPVQRPKFSLPLRPKMTRLGPGSVPAKSTPAPSPSPATIVPVVKSAPMPSFAFGDVDEEVGIPAAAEGAPKSATPETVVPLPEPATSEPPSRPTAAAVIEAVLPALPPMPVLAVPAVVEAARVAAEGQTAETLPNVIPAPVLEAPPAVVTAPSSPVDRWLPTSRLADAPVPLSAPRRPSGLKASIKPSSQADLPDAAPASAPAPAPAAVAPRPTGSGLHAVLRRPGAAAPKAHVDEGVPPAVPVPISAPVAPTPAVAPVPVLEAAAPVADPGFIATPEREKPSAPIPSVAVEVSPIAPPPVECPPAAATTPAMEVTAPVPPVVIEAAPIAPAPVDPPVAIAPTPVMEEPVAERVLIATAVPEEPKAPVSLVAMEPTAIVPTPVIAPPVELPAEAPVVVAPTTTMEEPVAEPVLIAAPVREEPQAPVPPVAREADPIVPLPSTHSPVEPPAAVVPTAVAPKSVVAPVGAKSVRSGPKVAPAAKEPAPKRWPAAGAEPALATAKAGIGVRVLRALRGKPEENQAPASAAGEAGRATSKIGRNAPCPCGSGLKFKRCHG